MNDPVRRPRASIPTTVCITAYEALMWIAFGKAVVNEDPFKQFTTYTELLKTTEIADILEALEGRLAEHPYCAIRSREPGDYLDDALSPRGPVFLRRIRADARRAERRLISYADLESELRAERAHNECLKSRLNEATDKLLDALRIEALTAFGQMDNRGVADTGASFEPIPFSVFDDPGVSITRQDRVCAVTKNGDRGKPSYDNVRFKMAEILALWPASAEEPSISLDALSAEWGLLECVAWIMLRDAAVVHSVAPEQIGDGRRPTTVRLNIMFSYRQEKQKCLSSQQAEAQLLDRLRKSTLNAVGNPDAGCPQSMTAGDWKWLEIREDARHLDVLYAAPVQSQGRTWRQVLISKNEMIQKWPSYGGPDGPSVPLQDSGLLCSGPNDIVGDEGATRNGASLSAGPPSTTQNLAAVTLPEYDFKRVRVEHLAHIVLWNKEGRKKRPPTIAEIASDMEHRFPGKSTQAQHRALANLWPKEARKHGRRKAGFKQPNS